MPEERLTVDQVKLIETMTMLKRKQRARIEALTVADEILTKKNGGPFTSTIQTVPSIFDLMTLANWILNGETEIGNGNQT